MAAQEGKVVESKEKNTGMAVIAYIIFLVPLLTDAKKDPFVKFHLVQSIGLVLFAVALNIVAYIPLLGWVIGLVGWVMWLVLWIMGIINAAGGKKVELPVIGKLVADKIKI